jgi:uncharacterized protein (TIGR02217 family)
MAFEDVVWPFKIRIDGERTVEREIEVATSKGGIESRNLPKAHSRRRYRIGVPTDDQNTNYLIEEFLEGRRGGWKSFPILDPLDHKSSLPSAVIAVTDQTLVRVTGTASQYQLSKVYEASGPNPYRRPILHPLTSTVVVSKDDVATAAGFSAARLTGVLSFTTAVATGVVVKAGFHFHTAVKLVGVGAPVTIRVGDSGGDDGTALIEYRDIELIEVLGE